MADDPREERPAAEQASGEEPGGEERQPATSPPAPDDDARDEPSPDADHAAADALETEEPLHSDQSADDEPEDEEIAMRQRLQAMSRRGFLTMAVAAGAGYAGWKWLGSRPGIDRRPWPYRRVLRINERLARSYFDRERLSPTFPPAAIQPLRANGRLGLDPEASTDGWTVTVHGIAGANGPVELPLEEIMRLPGHEMITELRCIEGWSVVNRWTGTRLIDLMERYPPATRDGSPPDLARHPERLVQYISMETPGGEYYVGLDMASAVHPQTMLVWEMNGKPLDWRHGAPLRLAIPVKYGIKNIKRIATIRYTDQRPADYWAKRGYDWYAGF